MKSEDIDHDGYTEYVVYEGSGVMDSYRYTIPWREEKTYFRWNGEEFANYRVVYAPPEYRFQAVQDGDRALLYGEISKALDFYRQVIYSDTLGWWSPDRERFFEEVYWKTWPNDSPTPVPPVPDPDEYDNLAAYARFKLMVAYIAQGWQADAKLMYDHLQRLYPDGKAGQAYAEMASMFWSQYEKSRDLAAGCQAAIQYASSHPDSIYYYPTGGDGYQVNRIRYSKKPHYLCPFQ